MYLPRIPETIEITPNVLTFTNSKDFRVEFKLRNNSDFHISFLLTPDFSPQLKVIIDPGKFKTITIQKHPVTSLSKLTVGWITLDNCCFPVVFPIRIVERRQELESLECKICARQYNETNRIPRVIPVCGHTLCEDCAKQIISGNTLKCPVDRRDVNVEGGATSLPRNFAILETIEERNTILNTPMKPISSEPTYPRIPCAENSRHESTFRCVICEANYCEPCFNKNHQGRVLSAHITIDIGFPKCTNCPDKFAEVVCTQADCSSDHTPICLHCYLESHKKHRYETIRKNLEQKQIVLDKYLSALDQKLRELEVVSHMLSTEEQEHLEYLKDLWTFGFQMKQCDYKKHKNGKSFAWWFEAATKLCSKEYGNDALDVVPKNVTTATQDTPAPAERSSLSVSDELPTRPSNLEVSPEAIPPEEAPELPIDSPTPESVRSSMIFGAEELDEVLSNLPYVSEPRQIDRDEYECSNKDTPEISHRPIDSPIPESVRSSMIFPASENSDDEPVVEISILLPSSSNADSTIAEEAMDAEEQSPCEHCGELSVSIAPETNDSSPIQGLRSLIDHAASPPAQSCSTSTVADSIEDSTNREAAQNSDTSDFFGNSDLDLAAQTEICESPIDREAPESARSTVISGAEKMKNVSEPNDRTSQHVTDVGPVSSHRPIDSPPPESVRPSMIFTDSDHHEKQPVETPILSSLASSSSNTDSTMTGEEVEPKEKSHSGKPSVSIAPELNNSSPKQGVRCLIENFNKIKQQPINNKNYIKTKIADSPPAQDSTESAIADLIEHSMASGEVVQSSETADFPENGDSDPVPETESDELKTDGAAVSKSCDNSENIPNTVLRAPNFPPSENILKQMGTTSTSTPPEIIRKSASEANGVETKETGIQNQTEAINSTPLEDPDSEKNFKFENLMAHFEKRTQSDNGTVLNVPRPVMRAKLLVNADLAKPKDTSDSKTPNVDVNHDIGETSISSPSPQPAPRTKRVARKIPSTIPPLLPASSDEQTELVRTRVAMFNNFQGF